MAKPLSISLPGTYDPSVIEQDIYRFWEDGGFAGNGIERMAEEGRTSPLSNQVENAIADGKAREVVLGDPVRRRIEAVLGAPVHDQYRCAEVPWMAGECGERNGLHTFADLRRVEILDADGEPLEEPEQPSDMGVYKEAEAMGVQIVPVKIVRDFFRRTSL